MNDINRAALLDARLAAEACGWRVQTGVGPDAIDIRVSGNRSVVVTASKDRVFIGSECAVSVPWCDSERPRFRVRLAEAIANRLSLLPDKRQKGGDDNIDELTDGRRMLIESLMRERRRLDDLQRKLFAGNESDKLKHAEPSFVADGVTAAIRALFRGGDAGTAAREAEYWSEYSVRQWNRLGRREYELTFAVAELRCIFERIGLDYGGDEDVA